MNALTNLLRKFSPASRPDRPGPGIWHFKREADGGKTRYHLRLEADGQGLLMVNASRAYQLNPAAAWMAYLYLRGTTREEALRALGGWFNAPAATLAGDYSDLCAQLDVLTDPDEHCALCELDLESTIPFSTRPSAPYRMDLALTYRCNNDCAHCYNARPRTTPELSTSEWKKVLDTVWAAGIPHVVFTGGEPTVRADLPELVAHAQANGQIAGINTNGRRLKDKGLVQALVDAGLDHVQITLESHDEGIHDGMVLRPGAWRETVAGIRNALDSRLFVMTNTTLLQANSPMLLKTLEFLAELGVPTVGLNALIYSGRGQTVGSGLRESELPALLETAREFTGQSGQKLIWYTPTRYCHFDPLLLELGIKGCTAALYNMCVEPDGAVIPCQSYYEPIGNLLTTPWESIWNAPLAVSLRERREVDPACQTCDAFAQCGGGCPLARKAAPEEAPHPIHAPIPL